MEIAIDGDLEWRWQVGVEIASNGTNQRDRPGGTLIRTLVILKLDLLHL